MSNGADIIFDDLPDAPVQNTKPTTSKGVTAKTTPATVGKQPSTTGKTTVPNTQTGKTKPTKAPATKSKTTPNKAGTEKKDTQKTEKKSEPKTFDLEDEYYDFDGF